MTRELCSNLRAKQILETEKLEVLADKGYYETDCLKTCLGNEIRPYVSKQKRANSTGDEAYYAECFRYEREEDVCICPEGSALSKARARKNKDGILIGYDYRNAEACRDCLAKERCTKSKQGRSIYRNIDQDFLDSID